eukprot:CAMPEP_0118934402 /NCGR_PEP_ID=MMETSP1169-20130426/13805_1 /TAXON_ID=36882 /ORGANISM="Pyramimonas obovata, Strain CCMP722" /LENGTH=134 /DNA_ID=CAMNT_0006877305 /DNA_START=168 /DNA_END=572 /DNA_ORIENTATION=-
MKIFPDGNASATELLRRKSDQQICVDYSDDYPDDYSDDTGLFLSDSDEDISEEEASTADSGSSILSSRLDAIECVGETRKTPCSSEQPLDSSKRQRRAPRTALQEDFRALFDVLIEDFGISSEKNRDVVADQQP